MGSVHALGGSLNGTTQLPLSHILDSGGLHHPSWSPVLQLCSDFRPLHKFLVKETLGEVLEVVVSVEIWNYVMISHLDLAPLP